jgi:hypothetical protein
MSFLRGSRRLLKAASIGVGMFVATAWFGCGSSSLKAPGADATPDGPGGGHVTSDLAAADAGGVGGATATPDVPPVVDGSGGTGPEAGGLTSTGGIAGSGGVIGRGGAAGTTTNTMPTGGRAGTGGAAGNGGVAGAGAGDAAGGGIGPGGRSGGAGGGRIDGGAGGAGGGGGAGAAGGAAGAEAGSGDTDSAADTARPDDATMPLWEVEGTWLIGWAGGARHFSWARFRNGSPGQVEINDGHDLQSNIPYWSCNGTGTWSRSGAPSTITLLLPSPCVSETLKFLSPSPLAPMGGSSLRVSVESDRATGVVEASKFDDVRCDATMTSCISPF